MFLAVYGLTLAASGKLAPVFAAFINSGQGWQWTIYWCAIGVAIAFVYCIFLMEETNYDRHVLVSTSSAGSSVEIVTASEEEISEKPASRNEDSADKTPANTDTAAVEMGVITYPRKTYLQKLSLRDRSRPNRVLDIMWAPFKFFTFPVVVWAGIM